MLLPMLVVGVHTDDPMPSHPTSWPFQSLTLGCDIGRGNSCALDPLQHSGLPVKHLIFCFLGIFCLLFWPLLCKFYGLMDSIIECGEMPQYSQGWLGLVSSTL